MTSQRNYWVYILTNGKRTVLYTGVTNNLLRRMAEHKNTGDDSSFTTKYGVTSLVYFDCYDSAYEAIKREKQIKKGPRHRKVDLINSMNPRWYDLTGLVISSGG